MDNPLEGVGEYWSNSNKEFQKSDPSIIANFGRIINPLTGLGSTLGTLHDAAGQGDIPGSALAFASGIPLLGYTKSLKTLDPKTWQSVLKTMSDWGKFNKKAVSNLATSVASDSYPLE